MSAIDGHDINAIRAELIKTIMTDMATVYAPTKTPDSIGAYTTTWAPRGQWAAAIGALGSRTALTGDTVNTEAGASIVLAWDAEVTEGDRIEIGPKTWEVLGVEERETLRLCIECKVAEVR